MDLESGLARRPSVRGCGSEVEEPTSSMQSILPALDHRAADASVALRVLCISLASLLAILPLAHVTALRNVLIGVIAAAALVQFRLAPWRSVPGFVPWVVWLAFAAASIGWSALPYMSFQGFRTDQFYPFVLFLVSFVLMRYAGARIAVVVGTAVGTLLCLATMFASTIAPGYDPKSDEPAAGLLGWLAWKAGDTTDSSTYVAFIAVPLFLVLTTSRHRWRRWAAGLWLLVFGAIGFKSESRTLIATLFVSFAGFLIVLGLLRGRLRLRSVVTIVVLGLIVSAASLEVISRVRLPGPYPSDRSAAVQMITSDPRPAIWGAYLELAGRAPWLGVGLGRGVPSRAYHLEADEGLRQIDIHAPSHAHNVLLDLVLQVGLVGLALWVWLHVEILRLTLARSRRGGDREKAWAAAAVALVLAMLVKNSTNDLIVFGNAILFWALMGTMLGLVWRQGGDRADRADTMLLAESRQGKK
jgi:O-antigen ligase